MYVGTRIYTCVSEYFNARDGVCVVWAEHGGMPAAKQYSDLSGNMCMLTVMYICKRVRVQCIQEGTYVYTCVCWPVLSALRLKYAPTYVCVNGTAPTYVSVCLI